MTISPTGDTTKFEFDPWGNMTKSIRGQDTILFQYITIGDDMLLSAQRDPEGHWIYFKYDNGGRVIQQLNKVGDTSSTPDADDFVIDYVLDSVGNITETHLPGGMVKYAEYNQNNRKTKEISGTDTTVWTYTNSGNVNTVKQPNENLISYSYNSHGQVTAIIDNLSTLIENEYRSDGNISTFTVPGQGTVTFQYDDAGRMNEKRDETGVITRYSYTISNQLASITDSLGNTCYVPNYYQHLSQIVFHTNTTFFCHYPTQLS